MREEELLKKTMLERLESKERELNIYKNKLENLNKVESVVREKVDNNWIFLKGGGFHFYKNYMVDFQKFKFTQGCPCWQILISFH